MHSNQLLGWRGRGERPTPLKRAHRCASPCRPLLLVRLRRKGAFPPTLWSEHQAQLTTVEFALKLYHAQK